VKLRKKKTKKNQNHPAECFHLSSFFTSPPPQSCIFTKRNGEKEEWGKVGAATQDNDAVYGIHVRCGAAMWGAAFQSST
jgi:hypothetical protein